MAHDGLAGIRRLSMLLLLGAALAPTPSQAQALPAPEPRTPNVYVGHRDESESFDLVVGISGGGGFDSSSPQRPVGYAGIKLGQDCCVRGKHPVERALTVTFDLGFDRFRSRNGVSGEFSVMIPVIRFPNPGTNEAKKFIRVYAEPGAGVRLGGGAFAYLQRQGDDRVDVGQADIGVRRRADPRSSAPVSSDVAMARRHAGDDRLHVSAVQALRL